jgi:cell division protein FtsB
MKSIEEIQFLIQDVKDNPTTYLFKVAKNKFFIAITLFFVWMLFFDTNNLLIRYDQNKKLTQLRSDRTFYQEQIVQVKRELDELTTNPEMLEKFAREKYYMKKNNEDIFVIVRKKN